MKSRFRLLRPEAGDTLVEVILTIAIMGLAFSAILGGVATQILVSSIHRNQATDQTAIRAYADAVQAATWSPCPTLTTYAPLSAGGTATYSAPSGYTASVIGQVKFFDVANGNFDLTTCPSTGSQQISLQMQSPDSRATETLVIVKRCTGARGGLFCP